MLRLNITSKDGGKYWLDFATQAEADAYKEQVKASAHWGKPAWTEERITPAILDEDGNEISPEVKEEINHPAEYEITEEDLSAEIAAKEKKEKDKEAAKLEAAELLKKSGSFTLAEVTKILKAHLGE